MKLSTEETLEKIKQGNEAVLKEVYLSAKSKFVGYISKEFTLDAETCLDLYQDSFCLFYKKVCSGKIMQISSSFDTLLIGFGRNMARNMIRKKREEFPGELPDLPIDDNPLSRLEKQAERLQVNGLLKLAGPDCKRVLTSFYYLQKSMKEIAVEMGYNGPNVAKKKKYQCLRSIRAKLNSNTWN